MVFAAKARARTFDFQVGDVGTVQMSMSHFIDNAGSTPLRLLESCTLHGRVAGAAGGSDARRVGAGASEP